MYSILLKNIKTIVKRAEKQLATNLLENIETMYWEIGFELRYIKKTELKSIIKKLSRDLSLQPAIIIESYNYYRRQK
ncbi:MAG: hypothetical protein ABIJ18_00765 [archaeon]